MLDMSGINSDVISLILIFTYQTFILINFKFKIKKKSKDIYRDYVNLINGGLRA